MSGIFIKSISWFAASKVVTQIGAWVATIIIARLLSPEDYALVAMSGLLVGIITIVGDFGLNTSIIQKKDLNHKELSAVFWQYVLLGAFVFFLLYLLAPLGSKFWDEPELINLIRLSAFSFFIGCLGQIPSALLQKEMNFRDYGIIMSLSAISGSVVSLLLAYYGHGPYSLILGTLSAISIKTLLVYCVKGFIPQFVLVTQETGLHLKTGLTITASRYLWWYYNNIDYWIASKLLGKNLYGSYYMAFQLASLPTEKIASIVGPVSLPALSRISDDSERVLFFLKIVKYIAFIAFPVLVGLFWAADDFFILVLGDKWLGSIFVFKIFVLIFPLRCLSTLNNPLLASIRRLDVDLKNTLFGAIFATAAFAVGSTYGIDGLAYSWLSFYPLFFIVCLSRVSRVVGFTVFEYVFNLRFILYATATMSLFIYLFILLFNETLFYSVEHYYALMIRLAGIIIVGIISFCGFFIVFDRSTFDEVMNFFRNKPSS